MGEGKASLKIGRKQVIELILEKLRVTFDDVLIIGNSNFICPLSQVRGFVEPLHAIYSKRCLPAIKNCLEKEDLRIKSFFSKVKCKYIPENKKKRCDPSLLSFVNLNTPEAVESVRNLSPSLH